MKPECTARHARLWRRRCAQAQLYFFCDQECFENYGFQPLETPAMENLDTLMGKYGEEGDKLIFKILNNGLERSKKCSKIIAAFENVLQGKNDKNLTERALALRSYHSVCTLCSHELRAAYHFRLSVTRYNPCGAPTVRSGGDTANFTNAMPMWWAARVSSTK